MEYDKLENNPINQEMQSKNKAANYWYTGAVLLFEASALITWFFMPGAALIGAIPIAFAGYKAWQANKEAKELQSQVTQIAYDALEKQKEKSIDAPEKKQEVTVETKTEERNSNQWQDRRNNMALATTNFINR